MTAIVDRLFGKSSVIRTMLRPVARAAISAMRAREERRAIALAQEPEKSELGRAAMLPDVVGVGNDAGGRQVVMLVVSDLRIDPRVEREARALAGAGYEVTVICPDPTQGKQPDLKIDWGDGVAIEFLHWSAASFVMHRPLYMAEHLFKSAMRYKPFAFHAHDLNTCYAGLAAARTTGAHFVADFHEWTSENVHWNFDKLAYLPFPGEWKAELQALEKRCLDEASAVITVCDSIADTIRWELDGRLRPVVIRNIPDIDFEPSKNYPPLKMQLGLPDDVFVLLWQGGTGPTRGIEQIIEALEFAPNCTFAIRGPSLDLFGEEYKAVAVKAGAGDRLILLDPVKSCDVVAAARGADLGIWTLPALCRNFTFALPNKIFEYMASGVPVLAAHYPEAKRLVEGAGIGLCFDPDDPRSIAQAINRFIENPEFHDACRARVAVALGSLDAEREWQKLVELYGTFPVTAKKTLD